MKCIACGGEAVAVTSTHYRCPYCTYEFDEAPAASAAPMASAADSVALNQASAQRAGGGVSVFEDNINGVLEISWFSTLETKVSGSGLLVDKRGYAITNAHVVSASGGRIPNELTVKLAGEKVSARVLRLGDNRSSDKVRGIDLALIKLDRVPEKAKALSFAEFDEVRIGEQVFVIGNSLGDGICITSGIVSDKQRKVNGHTVMMTDCAINGGNSGGPIFNNAGSVIGVMCSSRLQADGSATEGMNYAVPANIVRDFLEGKHIAVKLDNDSSKIRYKATSNISGAKCPRCNSTDTGKQDGVSYCYDCSYEW